MLDDLSPLAHSPLSPFPTVGLSFGRRMGHMLMSPLRENNYRSLFCLQSEVFSLQSLACGLTSADLELRFSD